MDVSDASLLGQLQQFDSAARNLVRLQSVQIEAIRRQDLETLEATLPQKQRLIDQLKPFPAIVSEYQTQSAHDSNARCESIEAAFRKVQQLLNESYTNEQSATELLARTRKKTADELLALQQQRGLKDKYDQLGVQQRGTTLDVIG